ncbi:adenylate/guanylate cyclase domain-containing protein [Rhodoferax sp.]|uniref:adenylate/guanylate cyclase domain-containing protein n=1 Tax=Rhodoferax sp. TaxID=50421 RepID=UPI001ECD6021|nr:adenylate/guanylate cyclase domain-containing protein [Rhodoferax sp.]MBT9507676.1 adenylate/guanylate cyclase domain-containing protein [Rhodoferax sp.]
MISTAQEQQRFLIARDLDVTYMRRVRVMVFACSGLLIFFGTVFGIFFALRAEFALIAVNVLFVVLGLTLSVLVRAGRLRVATIGLVISLLLIFLFNAIIIDIPTGQMARSMHYYFPALALGSYFVLKNEPPWLHHGIPLICIAAFVWLASSKGGIITPYLLPDSQRPPVWTVCTLGLGILYFLLHIFVGDINRMESYLHSANNRFVTMVSGMFPKVIAERLLASGETFAERHANCSVLFADIVGFTGITERMSAEALVKMLSEIFSRFDRCVEQSGLTKIKTIGDAYMVAAGVPESNPDHARVLVALAQEMLAVAHDFEGIDLRIGIASGELVAGVIGQSRQVFDVWGDVVNVASRMESHGLPGRIQLSESSHALTKDHFDFELRSGITIKGKNGTHNVYLLRV